MRAYGIKAKSFKRFRPCTTQSKHGKKIAPNILNREFSPGPKNKVWVSDITYIKTGEGWLYLAIVMDLGSRRILGWGMSESLESDVVTRALDMALIRARDSSVKLFHSDRGVQYASEAIRKKLDHYGIQMSMSRKGNCYDNACAESFFHTLKTEYIFHERFDSLEEAKAGIFEWIEVFYNRQRIHSSLDFKTPEEYSENILKVS